MARTHNILTVLLLSAAPAAASPAAHGTPPAPPTDAAAGRPLLELRAQLLHTGRDKAQAEIARFRPLCDKDGYPLVGNVASKGDMYQPSTFCSDVRRTEKRS
jgi:hypothetical protein